MVKRDLKKVGKFAKRNLKKVHKELPKPVIIRGGMRIRCCCWTMWDPTTDEMRQLKDWEVDEDNMPDEINYSTAQLEKGGASGDRKHLQGYSEFKKKVTLNTIKRIHFRNNLHVERRRGTQAQAIEYTRKEDTRVDGEDAWSFEAGEQKRQGVHKDNIKDAVKQLDAGMTMDDIEDNFPVQMTLHKNKLIDRFIDKKGGRHLTPSRNNVFIYTGPTGTGKTTTAWLENPGAYKGVWPTGGRWWWPNYKGEDTIIFDEFRENVTYQDMLALLDIHPMSIEYKGGNTQNVSRKIILTTIRDPKGWYSGVEDKSELERRINENATIYDFKKGEESTELIPVFESTPRQGEFKFDEFVGFRMDN